MRISCNQENVKVIHTEACNPIAKLENNKISLAQVAAFFFGTRLSYTIINNPLVWLVCCLEGEIEAQCGLVMMMMTQSI